MFNRWNPLFGFVIALFNINVRTLIPGLHCWGPGPLKLPPFAKYTLHELNSIQQKQHKLPINEIPFSFLIIFVFNIQIQSLIFLYQYINESKVFRIEGSGLQIYLYIPFLSYALHGVNGFSRRIYLIRRVGSIVTEVRGPNYSRCGTVQLPVSLSSILL